MGNGPHVTLVFCWRRGVKDVMKKRLKSHYKKQKLTQSAPDSGPADLFYDYICVVDFEATCEEDNPPDFLHEIIEFPMVLISTHTLEIVRGMNKNKPQQKPTNFSPSLNV